MSEVPKTITVELDRDLAKVYLRGASEGAPGMVKAVAHVDQQIQWALRGQK